MPLWLILVLSAGVYWPVTLTVALVCLGLAIWPRPNRWIRAGLGVVALALLAALLFCLVLALSP